METSEFSYAKLEQGLAELTRALEEKAPKVLSTLSSVLQLSCSRTPCPYGFLFFSEMFSYLRLFLMQILILL